MNKQSVVVCVILALVFSLLITPDQAQALYTSNLLKNPGFEKVAGTAKPSDWAQENLLTSDITVLSCKRFEDRSFRISGKSSKEKAIYQILKVSGEAGDVIEFSGWSRAYKINNKNKFYGLKIGLKYTDGTQKWASVKFDYGSHRFQFKEVEARAEKPFDLVYIFCCAYNQPNGSYAWFDGLRVNKNPDFPRLMFEAEPVSDTSRLYCYPVVSFDEFRQKTNCSLILYEYWETKIRRVRHHYWDGREEWSEEVSAHDYKFLVQYLDNIPEDIKIIFTLSRKPTWNLHDAEEVKYVFSWLKDTRGYYRFNYDKAKLILERLGNHPKIAAWYLFDEPLYSSVKVDELIAAYKFVKTYTDKPVGVCFSSGEDFIKLNSGNGYCDFLLFDFYPHKKGNPIINNGSSDHCEIERHWRRMKFGTTSKKQWYGVVQAFGKNGTLYLEPSSQDIINQAREYKSLGASGIAYFAFDSTLKYYTDYLEWAVNHPFKVEDRPLWQNAIKFVNQEWLTNN